MEPGGQYVATALPMIQARGTGPQKRLSSELPRLSPIRKYSPAGTLTGERVHSPPPHEEAKGSFAVLPFRTTLPATTAIVSPGRPTTRLTKVVSARSAVGSEQECRVAGPPL